MSKRAKTIRADRSKSPRIRRPVTYVHLQYATLEEGLKAIQENIEARQGAPRVLVAGHKVSVTSLRLRTFLMKGTTCYICGKKATQFSVDKGYWESEEAAAHMNLWGTNDEGGPLLFTHDHVVDRAKGGADKMENSETCCSKCNHEKNTRENYS